MSNRITVSALALSAILGAGLGGCGSLVSDVGPDTVVVQARDDGPATKALAQEACAAHGRRSFGPLRYQCVDAKNVASCQQKAFVFACNVAPDEIPVSERAIAAAAPPSPTAVPARE